MTLIREFGFLAEKRTIANVFIDHVAKFTKYFFLNKNYWY